MTHSFTGVQEVILNKIIDVQQIVPPIFSAGFSSMGELDCMRTRFEVFKPCGHDANQNGVGWCETKVPMQVKHRHIETSFSFVEKFHHVVGNQKSGECEESVYGHRPVENGINRPIFVQH